MHPQLCPMFSGCKRSSDEHWFLPVTRIFCLRSLERVAMISSATLSVVHIVTSRGVDKSHSFNCRFLSQHMLLKPMSCLHSDYSPHVVYIYTQTKHLDIFKTHLPSHYQITKTKYNNIFLNLFMYLSAIWLETNNEFKLCTPRTFCSSQARECSLMLTYLIHSSSIPAPSQLQIVNIIYYIFLSRAPSWAAR